MRFNECLELANVEFVIQKRVFGDSTITQKLEKRLNVLFQSSILCNQTLDLGTICLEQSLSDRARPASAEGSSVDPDDRHHLARGTGEKHFVRTRDNRDREKSLNHRQTHAA